MGLIWLSTTSLKKYKYSDAILVDKVKSLIHEGNVRRNGFVTFSTVDVFLVTVTPAVDFGCHEMFIDLFLTRRISGAKITTTVRRTSTSRDCSDLEEIGKDSAEPTTLFHGGIEL